MLCKHHKRNYRKSRRVLRTLAGVAALHLAHGFSTPFETDRTGTVPLMAAHDDDVSSRSPRYAGRSTQFSSEKLILFSKKNSFEDEKSIGARASSLPSMLQRRQLPGDPPDTSQESSGILQFLRRKVGFLNNSEAKAKKNDSSEDSSPSSGSLRWWKKIPFISDSDKTKDSEKSEQTPASKSSFFTNPFQSKSAKDDDEKKMEQLQKQLEANQRMQLKLIERLRRDEEQEAQALREEQKIAAELAKLEEAQKRKRQEEVRKQREAEAKKRKGKKDTASLPLPNINPSLSWPAPNANIGFSSRSENSEIETKESLWSSGSKYISEMWDSFTEKNQEEWVPAMPKTRLFPGEVVPVQIGGIDLLVIASRDGKKLHCLANTCSHLGTPLETGVVESRAVRESQGSTTTSRSAGTVEVEDCIVCPLHHTAFALDSGEVRGEWCPYPPVLGPMTAKIKSRSPVAVFDIRARGKNIEVRINSSVDEKGQQKKLPARKEGGSARADL
jgi:nitrite reductase/ring-hydroxylating ferredoxin subunit